MTNIAHQLYGLSEISFAFGCGRTARDWLRHEWGIVAKQFRDQSERLYRHWLPEKVLKSRSDEPLRLSPCSFLAVFHRLGSVRFQHGQCGEITAQVAPVYGGEALRLNCGMRRGREQPCGNHRPPDTELQNVRCSLRLLLTLLHKKRSGFPRQRGPWRPGDGARPDQRAAQISR